MKISIVGCAGVPAAYGGFETLAENIVLYRQRHGLQEELTVYCSASNAQLPQREFHGAHLVHLPMSANGVASIAYDAWSMLLAVVRRADVILVLGVSGAIAMPLVRCLSYFRRVRIITNIDGVEWRRAKWRGFARHFLRMSESLAVRFSDVVVADNLAVADHVQQSYGAVCTVIAYGGDHAIEAQSRPFPSAVPSRYALALCRIEPENNVEMILEAFSRMPTLPLVFIGNWDAGDFGRRMRARFQGFDHLLLLDPEYDPGKLKTLRAGASLYVHGHSAGGTNPSLVEMMHFGVPIACYDCVFNRHTTQGGSLFFSDAGSLVSLVAGLDSARAHEVGARMEAVARESYTWDQVGHSYFQLFHRSVSPREA